MGGRLEAGTSGELARVSGKIQDINMRIDAYESWERPLYVAEILDMDRTFSYLWIRIFISVNIRKNVS